MSYHIVDISTTGAKLSVKDNQLHCRNPDGSEHKLPMEDVASVLVNCFSAEFHSSFLIAAAEYKIPVIVCDKFKPVSMVLPVQRASDTLTTRAQIQAAPKLLQRLWQKTIDAKCANQYDLLQRIAEADDKRMTDFKITLQKRDLSKEANCARLYWSLFSQALGVDGYRRLADYDGLDGMLNYGYAVLMLRVQQKLLALGLDPLYGIGHATKERSLPLSYDLMEPFRTIVDERIFGWIKKHCAPNEEQLGVGDAYKRHMQQLMNGKFAYLECDEMSLDQIVERVIKSFRHALMTGKERDYQPWTRRNSRWVG